MQPRQLTCLPACQRQNSCLIAPLLLNSKCKRFPTILLSNHFADFLLINFCSESTSNLSTCFWWTIESSSCLMLIWMDCVIWRKVENVKHSYSAAILNTNEAHQAVQHWPPWKMFYWFYLQKSLTLKSYQNEYRMNSLI